MLWGGAPKMHPRLVKLQERLDKRSKPGNVGLPIFMELAKAFTELDARVERLERLATAIEAYMVQETRTNEIASVETVLNLSRRLQALEGKVGRAMAIPK